jgi:hypothetical protein
MAGHRLLTLVMGLALLVGLTGCAGESEPSAESGADTPMLAPRPAMPEGIIDLTLAEAPPKSERGKDWFLHCGGARGWAQRDELDKCDDARQILVTLVPAASPVRHELKVGDVILGVNGEYFSKHPIYQFREASLPAKKDLGRFDVILWRKGWEKERAVTLDLTYKPLDFTKGDEPGRYTDWNLGPTGARGWMQGLNHESFVTRQILITTVEAGSPAEGVLQKGDVILGIGDKPFDRDARRAFGEAITQAETEAGGGELNLLRWRDGQTQTVTVNLPVLGSYSDTTPWDCAKSRRILENACEYLIENDIINRKGLMHGESLVGTLALMSTGKPEHMAIAKAHVEKLIKLVDESGEYPPEWGYSGWGWGYGNLVLTEYYLLTGDERALPGIRKFSEKLAIGQSGVGSWGHRMANTNHGPCHGYGAMNQVGNVCVMSLMLAQRCGVTSPEIERAVDLGAAYVGQFIDIQPVPYGDHPGLDPGAHDDNGKASSAAVVFAIHGDRRGTAFFGRMSVASHAARERGHTGVWWSLFWGPLGAARAGQPGTSAFLHETAWLYDLERRWDGGFTYQGKMNTGYGLNDQGRQNGGSEHQYGHWDTTCTRILMYTLPMKRLCITGKDVLTVEATDADVAMLIDAGRRPPKDDQPFEQMYDDRNTDELLALLGNWSPVVRNFAAQSLVNKSDVDIAALTAMLDSDNRYARYGACSALKRRGEAGAPAVDALIGKLAVDDALLRMHAAMALAGIGDQRAVTPMLEMVAGEINNDPRDLVRRFASRALFGRGGLLHESIEGVDRDLLFAASRRLLVCKGGYTRSLVGSAVIKKLTVEELQGLWPDLIPAMMEVAPTEIMFASGIRETVAKTLADNHIAEGMPLILDYMRLQKPHGSGDRNPRITGWLTQYGAAAKPLLPAMESYLAFLEQDHPWTDKGQPPPASFYKGQVRHLKAAIESIRNATEAPELMSIKPYLGE